MNAIGNYGIPFGIECSERLDRLFEHLYFLEFLCADEYCEETFCHVEFLVIKPRKIFTDSCQVCRITLIFLLIVDSLEQRGFLMLFGLVVFPVERVILSICI